MFARRVIRPRSEAWHDNMNMKICAHDVCAAWIDSERLTKGQDLVHYTLSSRHMNMVLVSAYAADA